MKDTTIEKPLGTSVQLQRYRLRRIDLTQLFLFAAGLVVMFLGICAIVPQWVAPYSPTMIDPANLLKPPSASHLFGTDYFGRDVFTLVVYGSRDSLLIGLTSVIVGGVTGGVLGAISGYVGGLIDLIIMRIIEVLMTIPGILLALAIAAALGPSTLNVVLAIASGTIPRYARVMRSQILSVKLRSYVTASRSIGSSEIRIFWKHVLPNSTAPFLVMATIGIGTSILTGSSLSFLGLGVMKEIPDWGTVLSQGRGYLTVAWWVCTFPGLAIALFVLSVNVIGDQIRDVLDPKKSNG
ncbi:peptide ABC transporter permease [Brevibacillus reuszeri]|uniref:Peptide ABC transporter permease n=1 Tax=Brevibacillus reuszeri TaxID=54915 RepID=A0ABQ0TGF0_9BACL|nr:ABC transporter permease [Brevibacillus reuszeri]MED1857191.1 ABC transporter permease [Brevibacillus reuszeri]GED66986.1 peptide ABC transporter permease [Brevibacillus reuszeri]